MIRPEPVREPPRPMRNTSRRERGRIGDGERQLFRRTDDAAECGGCRCATRLPRRTFWDGGLSPVERNAVR